MASEVLESVEETSTVTTDVVSNESESVIEDEVLVEEISIDGMCGVY